MQTKHEEENRRTPPQRENLPAFRGGQPREGPSPLKRDTRDPPAPGPAPRPPPPACLRFCASHLPPWLAAPPGRTHLSQRLVLRRPCLRIRARPHGCLRQAWPSRLPVLTTSKLIEGTAPAQDAHPQPPGPALGCLRSRPPTLSCSCHRRQAGSQCRADGRPRAESVHPVSAQASSPPAGATASDFFWAPEDQWTRHHSPVDGCKALLTCPASVRCLSVLTGQLEGFGCNVGPNALRAASESSQPLCLTGALSAGPRTSCSSACFQAFQD